jgi:hypothetical protein
MSDSPTPVLIIDPGIDQTFGPSPTSQPEPTPALGLFAISPDDIAQSPALARVVEVQEAYEAELDRLIGMEPEWDERKAAYDVAVAARRSALRTATDASDVPPTPSRDVAEADLAIIGRRYRAQFTSVKNAAKAVDEAHADARVAMRRLAVEQVVRAREEAREAVERARSLMVRLYGGLAMLEEIDRSAATTRYGRRLPHGVNDALLNTYRNERGEIIIGHPPTESMKFARVYVDSPMVDRRLPDPLASFPGFGDETSVDE